MSDQIAYLVAALDCMQRELDALKARVAVLEAGATYAAMPWGG